MEKFSRTALLLGESAIEKLRNARVIVFGAGGVGGYAVEALARSGVGAIDVVDNDCVSVSNLNRQILALTSTVGRKKTEVAKERIHAINPDCVVNTFDLFYLPETADAIDLSRYDYAIDAIDTVAGKIEIAVRGATCGTPVISCMGAGNKLDATAFRVTDLYKTSVCPLARVMRRELKKRGVTSLKVVYSEEDPLTPLAQAADGQKRQTPGSVAFVPSVAGLIAAGEVIKDICRKE